MKRKLGINTSCLRGLLDEHDTLALAREVGFEAVMSNLVDPHEVGALRKRADALGMEISYLHAPFQGINDLWREGEEYLTVMNGMKTSIDSAAENGVPIVITHVSSGWTPPSISDRGLARYDELADYAAERGVTVALENQRKIGMLACLIDRYEHHPAVRFCFDVGHAHSMTGEIGWQDLFAHKLVATHIHDNMGQRTDEQGRDGDLHWLPLDGTCDYHRVMRKLDEYGYEGALILEIFRLSRADYAEMSPKAFLATAYERIKRIAAMGESGNI